MMEKLKLEHEYFDTDIIFIEDKINEIIDWVNAEEEKRERILEAIKTAQRKIKHLEPFNDIMV